jgi:hypothetical protein
MKLDCAYLAKITVEMTESEVQNIVQQAFGQSWVIMNELEIWTHYDKALSHQDDLRLQKQLATMINTNQSLRLSCNPSPGTLSLDITPSLTASPSLSPGPVPTLNKNPDFLPEFDHILEFSTFVVAQAKYFSELKSENGPPIIKPRIPYSLSYNEIVDARYISAIVAQAMSNPGELCLHSTILGLMVPVSVPWDSDEYIQNIGQKNAGKNKVIERELRNTFPPGPGFSMPSDVPKYFESPMTIVDQSGRILFWYLPDLISKNAQVPGQPFHFR